MKKPYRLFFYPTIVNVLVLAWKNKKTNK